MQLREGRVKAGSWLKRNDLIPNQEPAPQAEGSNLQGRDLSTWQAGPCGSGKEQIKVDIPSPTVRLVGVALPSTFLFPSLEATLIYALYLPWSPGLPASSVLHCVQRIISSYSCYSPPGK